MRIRYEQAISETLETLREHERQARGSKAATRLRMLILLKSGQAHSHGEVATLVGYSPTQVVRWWHRYRTQGLAALLREPAHLGLKPRMTPEARADLNAAMERGAIGSLEEARQYVREHWGIEYQSINGIWWHFRQEGTRKKTGRRRHQRASAVQQAAWKKKLRPGGGQQSPSARL